MSAKIFKIKLILVETVGEGGEPTFWLLGSISPILESAQRAKKNLFEAKGSIHFTPTN